MGQIGLERQGENYERLGSEDLKEIVLFLAGEPRILDEDEEERRLPKSERPLELDVVRAHGDPR